MESNTSHKIEVDIDRVRYEHDPAFPFPTRVDENGVRWFLQSSFPYPLSNDPDVDIKPRFRLLPRSKLDDILAAKSSSETMTSHNVDFSSFTLQAIKDKNEDRVFIHTFDCGTLFGVFDGHNGEHLSTKAVKELPHLLAESLRNALDRTSGVSLQETTRAVEEAFTAAMLEFDSSLFKGLDDTVKEFLEEYAGLKWGREHISYAMWVEMHQGANRPAFAVEGSTALFGFIPASSDHVWVACAGDSEAHLGHFDGNSWVHTPLSELHCTENPVEAERVRSEHPNEDVIVNNRVIGILPVTRALGDFLLKAPMDDVIQYYQHARPYIALQDWFDNSAPKYKTPPYLSAKPTFRHAALNRGDVIIFATDGLRDVKALHSPLTDTEQQEMWFSLAGAAASGAGNSADLAHWEAKLGHRFLDRNAVKNAAAYTVLNILFGQDELKLTREMTIDVPVVKRWQDDITLLVAAV